MLSSSRMHIGIFQEAIGLNLSQETAYSDLYTLLKQPFLSKSFLIHHQYYNSLLQDGQHNKRGGGAYLFIPEYHSLDTTARNFYHIISTS
jgi:hypothetical protein